MNKRPSHEVATDRSGMVFRQIPRSLAAEEIKRDLKLFKNPVRIHCLNCNQPHRFRILADDHADNNVIMIGCECGVWMRAVELRIPQMSDDRARDLGLWVPGRGGPTVEFDIDLED